jgi:hypothetical protein
MSLPRTPTRDIGRTCKALVVREPWASQIAEGTKVTEFRSWSTRYRGPLLIVMAKRRESCWPGCAVCVVDLVDCRQRGPRDFSWHLDHLRVIEPTPIAGRLGLFDSGYILARTGIRPAA